MNFLFDAGVQVLFSENVQAHFSEHRQRKLLAREAGGQLFARITHGSWEIVKATGPRRSDWRSRFGFVPSHAEDQKEIRALFEEGLHYVGDWHTHPETKPTPSSTDVTSITRSVATSEHQLVGFLLVIIGTCDPPDGFWVSLHTRDGQQLMPTYKG